MNALIESGLRLATPILLASLGATFTLTAGQVNLGLEGMMLIGAFAAFAGNYWFSSWMMGLLLALASSIVVGALYGWIVVRRLGNPYIFGIVLNVLAGAVTVFLLRICFGVKGSFSHPRVEPLPRVPIPDSLGDLHILGGLLAPQPITVYLAFALAMVTAVVLYRTPFGLYLRAAGQNPLALTAAGKSVAAVTFWACMLNTVFAALAGLHLSIGQLQLFSEGMTSGRGFVALAAAVFARGRVLLLVTLTVLYGAAESLSLRLQQAGVPSHFPLMIPYAATLLLLGIMVVRKGRNALFQQTGVM